MSRRCHAGVALVSRRCRAGVTQVSRWCRVDRHHPLPSHGHLSHTILYCTSSPSEEEVGHGGVLPVVSERSKPYQSSRPLCHRSAPPIACTPTTPTIQYVTEKQGLAKLLATTGIGLHSVVAVVRDLSTCLWLDDYINLAAAGTPLVIIPFVHPTSYHRVAQDADTARQLAAQRHLHSATTVLVDVQKSPATASSAIRGALTKVLGDQLFLPLDMQVCVGAVGGGNVRVWGGCVDGGGQARQYAGDRIRPWITRF